MSNKKQKKDKQLNIRVNEDTARYIELSSLFHHCTKTEFITKQVLRPEYWEISFENIDPLIKLMSNVSNNLNQIARSLNILKKGNEQMSEEQFQIILDQYKDTEYLFGKHDEELQKSLMQFYNVLKTKKIRKIEMEAVKQDGEALVFSDITCEGDETNGDS